MRSRDGVSYILEMISKEFPGKQDFADAYQEVADFLRNQDIPQKEVERMLRLLRRKCVAFMSVSEALRKWSLMDV